MATDARGRELYDAVCTECSAETQVPFKPDPSRGGVLCRDCWMKKRNSRGSSSGGD